MPATVSRTLKSHRVQSMDRFHEDLVATGDNLTGLDLVPILDDKVGHATSPRPGLHELHEFVVEPLGSDHDTGIPAAQVVEVLTADDEILDVRINLYTDDQDSPDPDGNPIGQTPAVFAVEVIARTATSLSEGSIPASAGVVVRGIEADNATAFQVLRGACEQVGWEFAVVDGQLHLAERLGVDRTSQFVLRRDTNMQIEALGDSDDGMVNILTAYGPGAGINRLQVTLRDKDSVAEHGPYPRSHEFPNVTTLQDLQDAAQAYLAEHSRPKTAFRVQTAFPWGEEPEYGMGDRVKVVDPRSGIVTTARIEEERRSFGTSGVRVTLYLNQKAKTLVDEVLGVRRLVTPLAAPTGITHTFDAGILFLRWKPQDAAEWEVWHTQETDGDGKPIHFVQIATVRHPRFQHEGLEIGSDNWYQLYARDGNRRRSGASEIHFAKAKDTTPPATPAVPTVESAIRGIIVRVTTPNTEKDLVGYRVHISTQDGFAPGPATLVDTIPGRPGEMVTGEYLDRTPGTTYYVRLQAVDTSGNVSDPSPQASAVAGRVGTEDFEDESVTTPKIPKGAVTDEKTVSRTETDGITTTSTSYVEIADMTMTIDLPVDSLVLVLFRSNVNNNTDGRSVDTRLQIDGINYNESRFTSSTANTTGNNVNMALVNLTAGPHTFKVFWKVTAGRGEMYTRQHFVLVFKR